MTPLAPHSYDYVSNRAFLQHIRVNVALPNSSKMRVPSVVAEMQSCFQRDVAASETRCARTRRFGYQMFHFGK